MPDEQVTIIGAGFGGLAAAIALVAEGCRVTVIESASEPGGKARTIDGVAAGPTVLTMRPVFEELFTRLGERLEDHVSLTRAEVLARHYWEGGASLDLFDDQARSLDAIGSFAGNAAARGYSSFCNEARRIYETLEQPFIRGSKTNPLGLSWRIGPQRLGQLWGIKPWEPLWGALGRHFDDVRLRQLFGRYATYTGASPFAAPATLMLIAHVEAMGVWLVDGGMRGLAAAMAKLAERKGVVFRYGETWNGTVEGQTVFNGDPAMVGRPLAPRRRSLSAMVWTGRAKAEGAPLTHHNVFFSNNYKAEFNAIRAGRLPRDPTVYVCAQDRAATSAPAAPDADRLQYIINAPANGDRHPYSPEESERCLIAAQNRFHRAGLTLHNQTGQFKTPSDFEARFPGSGGALYGRATHGAMAAFQRPGARTRNPDLYLAGGGAHPGAGVPMATLSGLQAASALLEDRASTRRLFPAAMPGGTSMRSAMTGSTG